ncbi:conserved hypothetical protein [Culex quinquefasciatus]|uniref:Uncharacterized protein n=1 Tax=Culex quinquefasciatus TaxID=7176 RepID=B0WLY4_CULQU|nr:conserved hypothetical protein [Culex quinquefasciatus]|eukprot:XP_001849718.1 conserved hypothetical protein [Culex quinquefasciatus]
MSSNKTNNNNNSDYLTESRVQPLKLWRLWATGRRPCGGVVVGYHLELARPFNPPPERPNPVPAVDSKRSPPVEFIHHHPPDKPGQVQIWNIDRVPQSSTTEVEITRPVSWVPQFCKFDRFEQVPLMANFQTIEQYSLEYTPERRASIDPHIDD